MEFMCTVPLKNGTVQKNTGVKLCTFYANYEREVSETEHFVFSLPSVTKNSLDRTGKIV